MTQTLFDFSDLFVGCIHTKVFTNAINQEEIRLIFANFLSVVKYCSKNDWEKFQQEIRHCHEVKKDHLKTRIGKLINWKKKDIDELERKLIWQIPLGEKARLFGILEKNKPIKNNNLFRALLFEPNHKTYRKSGKNILSSLKDLVCLFSEEEECSEISQPKLRRKK